MTLAPDVPARHLTTTQALAAHDVAMRERAATSGIPLDRTATVGMHLDGDLAAIIYMHDGRVRYLDMREDSAPIPMSADLLTTLTSDAYDLADPAAEKHAPFVFADAESLRRTAKVARRLAREHGTLQARGTSRLLDYRANLPFSVYAPVLTDCLTARYWLGPDVDTASVSVWDAAFAHGKRTGTREAFSHLIDRARDGATDAKMMKAIAGAERFGARAAQYGSSHSQCSAFTRAGTLTDAHTALLSLDPLLRERNTLAGTITELRVREVGEEIHATVIGEPGKMREGSRVLLFDGRTYGANVEVTMQRLDFADDTLTVVMSPPGGRNPDGRIIDRAHTSGNPLYLTAAPLLMVRRSPRNRRWSDGHEVRNHPLDIPADIALAGAPVTD